MLRQLRPTPRALLPWVLVGNAARARCFERDPDNQALRELADFVHPEGRQKGQALGDDRPGLVHKGEPSTRFERHTDVHVKQRQQFARELAHYLESAALAHRFPAVVLFASNPFLGELRAQMGPATLALLEASAPLDLVAFSGAELERRVAQALQTAQGNAA